jgi:hypothetical protein
MRAKKRQNYERLFNAIVDQIYFKRISELTDEEAISDGFDNKEAYILGLLRINHVSNASVGRKRFCYIVKFHKNDSYKGQLAKSILFTHFKEKLVDGTKQQTTRMIFMPTYIEGEAVSIMFQEKKD